MQGPELEEGLISVINRFDPVPHLSLDAALRMVLAAEKLADEGLSWQQTLGLVVGTNEPLELKLDMDRASHRHVIHQDLVVSR